MDCPRCGEGDNRHFGMNRCGLCECEFFISTDGVKRTGLDDGPYLPGRAPRKKPAAKSAVETREVRSRAWATRRERYGERGHR
jgi:hypothetical protein